MPGGEWRGQRADRLCGGRPAGYEEHVPFRIRAIGSHPKDWLRHRKSCPSVPEKEKTAEMEIAPIAHGYIGMNAGLITAMALRPEDATNLVQFLAKVTTRSECRCPECECVIYSRRFDTCRDCGADLPPNLRMTRTEQARVKADVADTRRRLENFDAAIGSFRRMGTLIL
jgi:hypothetical protein